MIRLQQERLAERLRGRVIPSIGTERDSEIVMGEVHIGIGFDRRPEIGDGGDEVTTIELRRAALQQQAGELAGAFLDG